MAASTRATLARHKVKYLVSAVVAAAALVVTLIAGPGVPATASTVHAAAPKDAVTLIPLQSTWSFRYEHSWPTGWTEPGFADSAWKTGKAPLGWGGNASTHVTFPGDQSAKPQSMILRKSFTVEDRKQLTSATFSVMADDGVVVFVNGKEIGRANLPSGKVAANTYASKAPNAGAAQQLVTLNVPLDVLRDGKNVIAASTRTSTGAARPALLSRAPCAPRRPLAPCPHRRPIPPLL